MGPQWHWDQFSNQDNAAAARSQVAVATDHICAVKEILAPSGITKKFLLHYVICPKVQKDISCKFYE